MSQIKPAAPVGGAVALCAAIAAVYLAWAPPSADLAAQTFRAEHFSDHGPAIWSDAWYGGFHLPGYSVLYPPLAALIGVRLAGALAALSAAALFAALARRRFGERAAALGSLWFAAGVGGWLFTGRMTFMLGVAIGLGALLAADARRAALAAALAALTALASPVAGAFLVLAGLATGLAGARSTGAALALPAAGITAALGLAFPTLGDSPFALSSFTAIPLAVAGALLLLGPEHRALRIGAVLYGLLALAVFALPNPLGGNVVRLGALFAGPLAALCLASRPRVLVAVALPLLYWQLASPVRDTADALGDPSTELAFHAPLLTELERRAGGEDGPHRVHVPPTRNRWEAVHVARRFPLARGWLRQLESDDFDLFTDGELTAEAYAAWLAEHAVGHVAVPDAGLDWLSRDEVALIDTGLPFLEPVWEDENWRLFRVAGEDGLLAGEVPDGAPALRRLAPDRFRLEAPAGEHLLRLRWTPYWRLEGAAACAVEEDGWTRVELEAGGAVELAPRFSLPALAGRGRSCSG